MEPKEFLAVIRSKSIIHCIVLLYTIFSVETISLFVVFPLPRGFDLGWGWHVKISSRKNSWIRSWMKMKQTRLQFRLKTIEMVNASTVALSLWNSTLLECDSTSSSRHPCNRDDQSINFTI
jgi:hypothetical protein